MSALLKRITLSINSDHLNKRFVAIGQIVSYSKAQLFPKSITINVSLKHYQCHFADADLL